MNLEIFQKRFHPTRKAHKEFVDELKLVDSRLDCVFNVLESCWMVIIWNSPVEWNWVMTLRDHETGERYLPCGFVIDRLKELKEKWFTAEIFKEIEKAEEQKAKSEASRLDDWAHELAKDLRKPLLNDMDGVVSSKNVFQVL